MKVETIIFLPHFPGFYHSLLYSEDQDHEEERNFVQSEIFDMHDDFPQEILEKYMETVNFKMYPVKLDYDKYCEDCGKKFAETFGDYLKDKIPSFKVDFMDIQNPAFYNYTTDKIKANVSFEYDEVSKYLKENVHDFQKFLDENVKKSYREDSEENHAEYYFDIDSDVKQDSYYFSEDIENVLAFILENEYGKDDVEFNICCDVLDHISLFCYYDITQEFSDFFYSEKAEEIAKEYARLKKQGEDYLEVMKDEKYIPVVKENMKNIVSEMADEITKYIENYEEIA